MKAILAATQTKLAEVTALKFIDENTGQLDYYSPNMPVKFPCALIDINDGDFSDIGKDRAAEPQNRQMGNINLVIVLANLKLTNSSLNAPAGQKVAAFAIWDIMEDIHKKVHGWRPTENASPFVRKGFGRVQREDGVQEYRIRYTATANNV